MSIEVVLRDARAEDSDFAFDVKKAALGPYVDATWGWDEASQLRSHERDFDPAEIAIIVVDGVDAGWLIATPQPDRIDIGALYLLPDQHRIGIGSRLVRELLDEARLDAKAVHLQVLKVNEGARRFYERLGFKVHDETETHWRMSVAA